MTIEWTDADIVEARRRNRRLDKMPRFRMKTAPGRWLWNSVLHIVELTPWRSAARQPVRRGKCRLGMAGRDVAARIIKSRKQAPRGLIVEFHGGGWTVGNARMSDGRNAEMALATGFAVAGTDYRLAVNHTIDQQVDDCESALLWALEHGRREFGAGKVTIYGESAGAHLALLALLRLRDSGRCEGIGGVHLSFGLFDFAGSDAVRGAPEDLLILHGPTIQHVLRDLTPGMTDEERRSPKFSPLYADLTGLPPALVVVGARDVLLDENVALAERWTRASGNCELLVAPESAHSFTQQNTAIGRKTRRYIYDWLSRHG